MSTHKRAWFIKWNPSDFLSSPDVMTMTAEEVGQYVLLLFAQWLSPDCSLDADPKRLAVLARTPLVSPAVMRKFEAVPSKAPGKPAEASCTARVRNIRLYCEWLEAEEKSLKAKESINHRWKENHEANDTNVLRTNNERNTTNSQTKTYKKPVSKVVGAALENLKNEAGNGETPTPAVPDTNVLRTNNTEATLLLHITWVKPLQPLTEKYGAQYVADVINFAKAGGFWKLQGPAAVIKNWNKLVEQYEESRKSAAKPQPVIKPINLPGRKAGDLSPAGLECQEV
jgi:uncharacterized protein YdaU (DUF1376 family)